MATEANRDAAEQSLDIAKSALAAGNLDKAQKFAEKAMKLYPSDEVSLSANQHTVLCLPPMIMHHIFLGTILCSKVIPPSSLSVHRLAAHHVAKACAEACFIHLDAHVHACYSSSKTSAYQSKCLFGQASAVQRCVLFEHAA